MQKTVPAELNHGKNTQSTHKHLKHPLDTQFTACYEPHPSISGVTNSHLILGGVQPIFGKPLSINIFVFLHGPAFQKRALANLDKRLTVNMPWKLEIM